jgi:hypothetical protein
MTTQTNPVPETEEIENTVPETEVSEVSENSEWNGFVADFDIDETEVAETEPDAQASAPPAEPAEKPEETSDDDGKPESPEAKVEEPSDQPKPEEVVQETPVVSETPTSPQTPQAQVEETPAGLSAEQRAELRQQALTELEKSYVMSDEDALAFEENPGKVLPQMAAKVQLAAYEQVVQTVMAQLPNYIGQIIEQRQTRQSAEEEFFNEYSDLRNYRDQVTQVATMWNQMNANRQISVEEKRREIAKFARAAVGLGDPQVASAPAETPSAPMTPPQAPPLNPRANSAPHNPWEAMAVEMEKDPDNF